MNDDNICPVFRNHYSFTLASGFIQDVIHNHHEWRLIEEYYDARRTRRYYCIYCRKIVEE